LRFRKNNSIGFGYLATWDNGTQGNYGSDYDGVDLDGDGIGDTPYMVPPNNRDNYPFMDPLELTVPIADAKYIVDRPLVTFDGFASWDDIGIVSYFWAFGDGT